MDHREASAALAAVGNGMTADALETETLDFKLPGESHKATYNLLADALVCFANAHGGTVVLGVDDKATNRHDALRGVPTAYSLDSIRKGIFDRSRPPITPFAEEVTVDDVRLILVSVPPGVMPHSNAAGLSTRRLGKECLPYPPDQQREVMIARGQVDWSADASSVGLPDLSAVEFERLRQILDSRRPRPLDGPPEPAPSGVAQVDSAQWERDKRGRPPAGGRISYRQGRPELRVLVSVQAYHR